MLLWHTEYFLSIQFWDKLVEVKMKADFTDQINKTDVIFAHNEVWMVVSSHLYSLLSGSHKFEVLLPSLYPDSLLKVLRNCLSLKGRLHFLCGFSKLVLASGHQAGSWVIRVNCKQTNSSQSCMKQGNAIKLCYLDKEGERERWQARQRKE